MRRWREGYQEHGYDGLYDYRKRRPSPKQVPAETLEEVLHLYREQYLNRYFPQLHRMNPSPDEAWVWDCCSLRRCRPVRRSRGNVA
jgi:hypothetical protein